VIVGPTPSQTIGPFFGFALPFPDDASPAEPGVAGTVRIEGRLLDGENQPVDDGLLEVWAGDQFARCRTDPEGAFHFSLARPAGSGASDETGAAPHFEVLVFARGLLRHLVTRLYLPDEQDANAADPVLARVPAQRRHTLVARPAGDVLVFDVRLQGDDETVFFAV
jgi:protocatechuate 3,4-dioxygenase alpha subunit